MPLLINDVFAIDNHFTTFNQFMDITFEKIAWFCHVKERYFTSSIYTNWARTFALI